MKIGDYVVYESEWTKHNPWMKFPENMSGIIVDFGKWVGGCDCLLLMDSTNEIVKADTRSLRVINEI